MIARLLYAAVALCVLGTRPEHAGTRAAPASDAAVPAAAAPAQACPARPASGIGAAPADFAIPRNSR